MTTNTPIYLLKDRRPDSCFVDQIYDPDRDGFPHDDMAVVIPNEGALAIDRNDGFAAYVVTYVHPVTFKSTLEPIRILQGEDDVIEILSYGNDKFMLYYDDRTRPTKLIVDAKLRLFGSGLAEYRLVRTSAAGEEEIISLYMQSNENYSGDRIPLTTVLPGTAVKQATNCHTLHQIETGEVVKMEVYDHLGLLSVVVHLFVKKATILNDLASSTDIITGFEATANQMDGDDFYIYQKQDLSQLVISPELIYSDGTSEQLTIDNISCFLYGMDDFMPSFPGQRQKLLIKKYLGRNQVSELSEFDGRSRYVTLEKWVTVKANKSFDGIKISIIPMWNSTDNAYVLKLIAYSDRRDKIFNVTPYATIRGFDGAEYYNQQEVTIDIDLKNVFGSEASMIYQQKGFITLRPFGEFQRYIIQEDLEEPYVYGVESSTIRRPVVHYDSTLQQYFIPTSLFANKEAFLEAFYEMARPPYDPDTELKAPTPTHFTIRNVDTLATVIATPLTIDQYSLAWNIVTQGLPNQYVGGQLIVEFLIQTVNDYQMLYGVPVDVHPSQTGYNT